MTEREQFEAWWRRQYNEAPIGYDGFIGWEAWKAARAAAPAYVKKCEQETGVCVQVHSAERLGPCTPANCRYAEAAAPAEPPIELDRSKVICPNCCHQFRAIPLDVQDQLFAAVPAEDTALLDWADAEGHHDAQYESLRDELRDKGQKMELAAPAEPCPSCGNATIQATYCPSCYQWHRGDAPAAAPAEPTVCGECCEEVVMQRIVTERCPNCGDLLPAPADHPLTTTPVVDHKEAEVSDKPAEPPLPVYDTGANGEPVVRPPAEPTRSTEPVKLERWGLNPSGYAEKMDDGYWTPWHIAQEACAHPPRSAEPVAWLCEIVEADFSADTVTLKMLTSDYRVKAGRHWLSDAAPVRSDAWVEEAMRLADVYASCTWASSDTTKDARAALESYLNGKNG